MKTITNNKLVPYLYVVPICVISGLFIYFCIVFSLFTSFTNWDGVGWEMEFVGFKNYLRLLGDKSFRIALSNNLIFFIATVTIQASLGLMVAVLLKFKLRGSNLFKSFFFLPIAMAPTIIASIFRIILDPNFGSLNVTLRAIGLDFLAKSWLGDPKYALMSIIAVNIFQWMGFSMMMYYAGLMSISEDVYEAATIDGAGFWRTLFGVTIPLLKNTTSVTVVLGIVGSLKTFDIVMLLTRGGPGRSTEFLNTLLYKKALEEFNGGYSAAIGIVILILAVALAQIQIALSREKE